MNAVDAAAPHADPNQVGHDRSAPDRQQSTEHADHDRTSKRIIVGYGFWVFLLSDIVMFAAFFAAYAVLSNETAGGPSGRDLFELGQVAVQTSCLLLSSFTCGVATIGALARRDTWFYGGMAATFALGSIFLGLELRELSGMVAEDAGPTRSAFLSAFFALVGLHGLHVAFGLFWLAMTVLHVRVKGYQEHTLRRMLCFGLFWHAIDIVWVALFTVVYLMGAAR